MPSRDDWGWILKGSLKGSNSPSIPMTFLVERSRMALPDSRAVFGRLQSPPACPSVSFIPRSPSIGDQSSRFFLSYHQREVCSGHYSQFYDHNNFFTVWLPAMAQECLALQHSLVAFSALVYSFKVNELLRPYAFLHYSSALRDLRSLVEQNGLSGRDYHFAVATALQLSCVDVSSIEIIAD